MTRPIATLSDVNAALNAALSRPRASAAEGAVQGTSALPGVDAPAIGERDPETGKLVLSPKSTLPTAEAFVAEFYTVDGVRTLLYFDGELYAWDGSFYRRLEDTRLRQQLMRWLHEALHPVPRRTAPNGLSPFHANPTTVEAALTSIKALTYVNAADRPPMWLTGDGPRGKAPRDLIAFTNGILHVPDRLFLPPTPMFFNLAALPFEYDPDVSAPTVWLEFLSQLWPRDPDSIALLQEWLGYSLTSDTSLQKLMLMVGPPRSGKGTIAYVLQQLLGASNVAGPTTSGLAGEFGLQPLLNKKLAIISDARFNGRDAPKIVELLLCVTGEDLLTVNRKHMTSVSTRLGCRLMIVSNEIPALRETSGALASRFLVLKLYESFLGREDSTLKQRLLAELPGILLWALEGLDRLRRRGRFTEPSGSSCMREQLHDLGSPISLFVRECCVVAPDARVDTRALYQAYRSWCADQGRSHCAHSTFGRDLRSVVPTVGRHRGTEDYYYEGITLKASHQGFPTGDNGCGSTGAPGT